MRSMVEGYRYLPEAEVLVAKFGGGAVYDTAGFIREGKIIDQDPRRRLIVQSALGGDPKVTDLLLKCAVLVNSDQPFDAVFDLVKERHEVIGRDLGLYSVYGLLNEIHNGIAAKNSTDWIASRGEWIATQMMAEFRGGTFVDPINLIRLRNNGQISKITYQLMRRQLNSPDVVYYIAGFYGADSKGDIHTLPRQASDQTAAEVAVYANTYIGPTVFEKWQKEDGVLTASRELVDNPRTIAHMKSGEMREVTYRGEEIVQKDALIAAFKAGIPIHVRSVLYPDNDGTLITSERDIAGTSVIAIAGRPGFVCFEITKLGMNETPGVGRRLLQIFEKLDIPYDHNPTGLDTISIILDGKAIEGKEDEIQKQISQLDPDHIDFLQGLGVVCVVGEGIKDSEDVYTKTFAALQNLGIKVKAVTSATNGSNIVVAVDELHVKPAIRELHKAFLE